MAYNLQSTPPEEEQLFVSLRARTWDDFHGQLKVTESLMVAITAAKQREEALEHTLLRTPGLVKLLLSHLNCPQSWRILHISFVTL